MSNEIEAFLFDHNGFKPQRIVPAVNSVTWRLNKTGLAQLFLPYSDPLCTPERLAYGNRVLIRFASGLPDFGGVIDFPRVQTETGVKFSIYAGDRVLDWRISVKTASFTQVPPGDIARRMVMDASAIRSTGLIPASIAASKMYRTETYHLANILDALQRLARQSSEEYQVVPLYAGGQLQFGLEWAPFLGHNRADEILLVEGRNIETPVEMTEQGPVASIVKTAGGGAGGTTWNDRLVGIATDADAEAEYGYREYSEVVTGVFDQATLDATAAALLQRMKRSRKHFKLTALAADPSPFDRYDVGDIVTLQAFLDRGDWEFNGPVRITGRMWNASTTCRLEAEEWL